MCPTSNSLYPAPLQGIVKLNSAKETFLKDRKDKTFVQRNPWLGPSTRHKVYTSAKRKQRLRFVPSGVQGDPKKIVWVSKYTKDTEDLMGPGKEGVGMLKEMDRV